MPPNQQPNQQSTPQPSQPPAAPSSASSDSNGSSAQPTQAQQQPSTLPPTPAAVSQGAASDTSGTPSSGGNKQQTPAGSRQAGTKQNTNQNTTQKSLQLSELRESMAIMKDGSFRGVVACQSVNFDLMSGREREAVEASYQSFLNSLYFPIQILVRSQRVDIGPYMEKLSKLRTNQDNMLLGMLMDDYMNFIDALSQEANIMDKEFYVVVPYFPSGDPSAAIKNSKNLFTGLFKNKEEQHITIDKEAYSKAKDEIQNRVNAVTGGLFQMGVKSSQLNTKQLAKLYYNVYNPDTAVREPLEDFTNITNSYTRKGEGQAAKPHLNQETG